MKDDLIFEGKNYISSKRAAKLTGYTADYIGQLTRQGKVPGVLIGRAKFIEEDALLKYKKESQNIKKQNGVRGVEIAQGRKVPLFVTKKSIENSLPEKSENKSNPSEKKNNTISPLCQNKKLSKKDTEAKWTPIPSPYVSLLPRFLFAEIKTFVLVKYISILTLVFVGTAGVNFLNTTQGNKVANNIIAVKEYTALKSEMLAFVSFENKGWGIKNILDKAGLYVYRNISALPKNILNRLSEWEKKYYSSGQNLVLAPSVISDAGESENVGVSSGVVVVPSEGNEKDAETIERIKLSFSDEVNVYPDESGSAGIITPVFREKKGEDFLYVLVPVNN